MFFKPAGVGNGHVLQIEGVIRSKQKLFGCSAPELYGFHQVKKLPPFLSRKPAKIGADIGVHMRVLPQDHSSGLVVDPPGVPHDDGKIREIAGDGVDPFRRAVAVPDPVKTDAAGVEENRIVVFFQPLVERVQPLVVRIKALDVGVGL